MTKKNKSKKSTSSSSSSLSSPSTTPASASNLITKHKSKSSPSSNTNTNTKHTPKQPLSSSLSSSISTNNSTTTASTSTKEITKPDHDKVLQALRDLDWTKAQNRSRQNVIRDDERLKNAQGKPYCHSFIFGKVQKDPNGSMSWWSVTYPEQYQVLKDLMKKHDANFDYTHITLNKELRCKKHVDKGNLGPSYICAFGPFTGGELLVEKPGGGGIPVKHNIKSKMLQFNGATQPHETAAFKGERYTCVFYTSTITPDVNAVPSVVMDVPTGRPTEGLSNKLKEITRKLAEAAKKRGNR